MRLWHKDLIPVLPKQQLLGQWRECCAIARNIAVNGTPNHLLVNKVMDYPIDHFIVYSRLIMQEMSLRDYRFNGNTFDKYGLKPALHAQLMQEDLFADWHNDRYFMQCYANLEEKYDCGGIPEDEWKKVYNLMQKKIAHNILKWEAKEYLKHFDEIRKVDEEWTKRKKQRM